VKKPTNPKQGKVYIVMEYINNVSYVHTVLSTKKAAQTYAKYLKKNRPALNFRYHVLPHDVYLAHIPDEKVPK
jgi:hypothetical protein